MSKFKVGDIIRDKYGVVVVTGITENAYLLLVYETSNAYEWSTSYSMEFIHEDFEWLGRIREKDSASPEKVMSTNDFDPLYAHSSKVDPKLSPAPLNKYDRTFKCKVTGSEFVGDVYTVLNAFKTNSAALDHAVKKLLAAGKRGSKDRNQDLKEAIQSIERAIND